MAGGSSTAVSELLDEAASRLALTIYREALRRQADGRMPSPAIGEDDISHNTLKEQLEMQEALCLQATSRFRAVCEDDAIAARLKSAYGLDALELDILLLAAASYRESALGQALSSIRPPGVEAPLHVALLASLASNAAIDYREAMKRLRSTSHLARWRLLDFGVGAPTEAPLPARAVVVPEWLLAVLESDAYFMSDSQVALRRLATLPDPRVDTSCFRETLDVLTRVERDAPGLALGFLGADNSSVRRFVAQLGESASRSVVELDIDLLQINDGTLARLRGALRDVRWHNAFVLVSGTEHHDESDQTRLLALLGRVLRDLDWIEPIFLTANQRRPTRGLERDLYWVELPLADVESRIRHLGDSLERWGTTQLLSKIERADIECGATLYPLPPASAESAARRALRRARAREATSLPATLRREDLLEAGRAELAHRMDSIADPIHKNLTLDDMVLEAETLGRMREIIAYVEHATTVYDRWGFGDRATSRGVSAVFGGPPGTGKTMAAVAIANELGLELFRIDLSRVVSKYIGETESNLERVFKEATASRSVLLFDEADALFGKRTDIRTSVDRYANMEINYLLQRIESFDGIAILTTNKVTSMDDAFKRRLQFHLRFEPPDETMRMLLWKKLMPPDVPINGDVRYDELGRRFNVPGGNIQNIVIRAAFVAAQRGTVVDMSILVEAAEREVEQMGRVLSRSSSQL